MQARREEHQESELLPHLEPPVQPAREFGILGAPDELDVGCNHPRRVARGQESQCVHREGLVQGFHGDVVPATPVPGTVSPDQRPAHLHSGMGKRRNYFLSSVKLIFEYGFTLRGLERRVLGRGRMTR